MKHVTFIDICILVIVMFILFGPLVAKADILAEIDYTLKTIKAPIAQVASVSALVVSVQTDILGKDDVKAPIDVRKATGLISPIQHRRDSMKNIMRQIAAAF